MDSARPEISKRSIAVSILTAMFLVFTLPVVSLLFFLHTQSTFNAEARKSILSRIRVDQELPTEEREDLRELYETVPFSELMKVPEFASGQDGNVQWGYAVFRWMIRLNFLAIVSGVAVFLLAGLCVLVSRRSHKALSLGLLISWHVLRIYSALLTVVMAASVLALSYWVTVLWMDVYVPKLIFLAGFFGLFAVVAILVAIFKKIDLDFEVEGIVINKDEQPELWQELENICQQVGTEPVDQVIAGIDDNFFVTERPVGVDNQVVTGRTLFVSLALLKQFQGSEAEAVLAHEMAHFSGQDTMFSKQFAPLLHRYNTYLHGLYEMGLTLPIFYFMNCFRGLFELSLGQHSRTREFRADRIAAEVTSSDALAGALLRITAYSRYRNMIEQELFDQEAVLETANVAERIDQGFRSFAVSYATDIEMVDLNTAHPFDSHPPLFERFKHLGIPFGSDKKLELIEGPVDQRFYHTIENVGQIEQEQWQIHEDRFREIHEETLSYRFLPETDEERAVVEKAFPEEIFSSFFDKEIQLKFDYDKFEFTLFHAPIYYSEIVECMVTEKGELDIKVNAKFITTHTLLLSKFGSLQQQKILGMLNKYCSRYISAKEYQEHKKKAAEQETEPVK